MNTVITESLWTQYDEFAKANKDEFCCKAKNISENFQIERLLQRGFVSDGHVNGTGGNKELRNRHLVYLDPDWNMKVELLCKMGLGKKNYPVNRKKRAQEGAATTLNMKVDLKKPKLNTTKMLMRGTRSRHGSPMRSAPPRQASG